MERVWTSVSLGGVIVSTLARSARDVGSISNLYAIFQILIPPHTLTPDSDCSYLKPVQAINCMVLEPTFSLYMQVHYLYVCNGGVEQIHVNP